MLQFSIVELLPIPPKIIFEFLRIILSPIIEASLTKLKPSNVVVLYEPVEKLYPVLLEEIWFT